MAVVFLRLIRNLAYDKKIAFLTAIFFKILDLN